MPRAEQDDLEIDGPNRIEEKHGAVAAIIGAPQLRGFGARETLAHDRNRVIIENIRCIVNPIGGDDRPTGHVRVVHRGHDDERNTIAAKCERLTKPWRIDSKRLEQ